MKLSILICSLDYRAQLLSILKQYLQNQIGNRNEQVEIITYCDNRLRSTGFKRQWLLEQAHGEYVAFIDDDDWVYDCYIDEMLKACASGADCFAINGIMTTNGKDEIKWRVSKDYVNPGVFDPRINKVVKDDYKENGKHVYLRRTNHITGVKRLIALRAGFPDKSNAEDKHYSDRLVLRSEYKIDKPMYWYRFSTNNKQYK